MLYFMWSNQLKHSKFDVLKYVSFILAGGIAIPRNGDLHLFAGSCILLFQKSFLQFKQYSLLANLKTISKRLLQGTNKQDFFLFSQILFDKLVDLVAVLWWVIILWLKHAAKPLVILGSQGANKINYQNLTDRSVGMWCQDIITMLNRQNF